jgi:mRNA-degrading endonuclease toxin of MazEF toxin-antitoxin module
MVRSVQTKTIQFSKGDVVLVSFAYTTDEGQTQTKRRPAVIVSNDYNNGRLEDVLLVPLTCNISRLGTDFRRIIVPMNSPEGQKAGLRLDSVIDCTIITTIPKTLLVGKIGHFPDNMVKRIDECIKRSIDPDDGLSGAGVPRKPRPLDDDTSVALELPEPESDDPVE